MSTISSASTDTEVKNSIDDNASYEEDSSVSKCKAYITALRIWINRLSNKMIRRDGHGGAELQADIKAKTTELERARTWLADNGGQDDVQNTQFSYADFSGIRD